MRSHLLTVGDHEFSESFLRPRLTAHSAFHDISTALGLAPHTSSHAHDHHIFSPSSLWFPPCHFCPLSRPFRFSNCSASCRHHTCPFFVTYPFLTKSPLRLFESQVRLSARFSDLRACHPGVAHSVQYSAGSAHRQEHEDNKRSSRACRLRQRPPQIPVPACVSVPPCPERRAARAVARISNRPPENYLWYGSLPMDRSPSWRCLASLRRSERRHRTHSLTRPMLARLSQLDQTRRLYS